MFTSQLRSWSAALVSTVAAIGCTDDAASGPEGPDVDAEAPVIESSLPAAKAVGVAAEDKITIAFSEPMDRATVEAAYSSSDLPFASLSPSWSADGTVMTLSPDAGLVYAEGIGNDPSIVPAKTYTLTIGAGAADLAGNQLGSPFELTFATKRRMATAAGLSADLTRVLVGDTMLDPSTDISVGDNDLDERYISLVSFDLQKLPAGAVVESAIFSSRQLAPQGAPYGSLGAVMAVHLISATPQTFLGVPETVMGAYTQDGTAESKAMDVTAEVADDIAHRAERNSLSQYRLQIDDPTNDNGMVDKARFALATFEMSVVYLVD